MRARGVWTGLGIAIVGVAVLLLILIWTATAQFSALVPAAGLVVIVVALVVLVEQVNRARVDGAEAEHAARQVLGACANLSHADVVVRAAGLHVLGMIWRDWPREHDRILSIVTAWLREHARSESADTGDRPASDVAAAIWELVRRPDRPDHDPIDLAGCVLHGVDLSSARLAGSKLVGTELNRATLTGAVLTTANLWKARLEEAKLAHANLAGASLMDTRLTRADLTGADLSSADLRGAKLTGATLDGANVTDADLRRADLSNVDLMKTVGLTAGQLTSAITDSMTRIPAGAEKTSSS